MKSQARRGWGRRRVLITSGPTWEHLDPIRYLTNSSSGRMGHALASRARRLGARVTLVSGPTALKAPRGVRLIRVVSALEMRRAVMARARRADVVIGAAAVGDWRFARVCRDKVKRSGRLSLTLIPNPDIIKEVGLAPWRRRKGGGQGRQVVVGFALETRRRLAHARRKLAEKGLDLIVANGPGNIASRTASIMIIGRDGRPIETIRAGTKSAAAARVLKRVADFF